MLDCMSISAAVEKGDPVGAVQFWIWVGLLVADFIAVGLALHYHGLSKSREEELFCQLTGSTHPLKLAEKVTLGKSQEDPQDASRDAKDHDMPWNTLDLIGFDELIELRHWDDDMLSIVYRDLDASIRRVDLRADGEEWGVVRKLILVPPARAS